MNPRSIAKSIIGRLPAPLLYEVFYQSARALGVRGYEVEGPSGNFIGPIYDQTIIRPYLLAGTCSRNIIDLFRHFFGDGSGTFYDVGANIGLVCVPVAASHKVRAVAFEPDPRNCALLRANIALADARVEVVNAAVSDRAGTVRFANSPYNCGDHRLSSDGELEVQSVRLDDHPPADGLFGVKIDTQGAEPLIFQGGESVLAKAGLIVTEFWPWGMRRMRLDHAPMLAFAERHFGRALVLRHGQPTGAPLSIGAAVGQLQQIAATGGEHDFVDLVLMR